MDSQRKYILDHIRHLSKKQKIYILHMISKSTMDPKYMQEKNDGLQVDITKIPPNVITDIYTFIKDSFLVNV